MKGESAYFLSINRNKRSLTLNLKEPAGREIFMKLAKDADVVVENFTPGVAGRLGIDYESVKGVNPKIVYASISGFGQTGPYRKKPAYDQMMQGLGGIMSLTGEPDGEPQKMGIALTDIGAGMLAAYAVMVALFPSGANGGGAVHRRFDAGLAGVVADVSGGDVFRDGGAAGAGGGGASESGALSGVHVRGREVRERGGGERAVLGAVLRGDGKGGFVGASEVRGESGQGGQPEGVGGDSVGGVSEGGGAALGGGSGGGGGSVRAYQRFGGRVRGPAGE